MSSYNSTYAGEQSQCCRFTSFFQADPQDGTSRDDQQVIEEMDAMIANSVAQLNLKERQRGQEDLHGVSEVVAEKNDEIDSSLKELDIHLNSIQHGTVYARAEALNSPYVTDRGFRLMFLRSNRYDSNAAAEQIIKFFQLKLQLFGETKLVQDITLADLNEDDKECLRKGSMQILPCTDRARRQVLFQCPGLRSYTVLENELRARFYLHMDLARSKETQKRGIAVVTYAVGRFQEKLNGAGFVETMKMALALPLYYAGVHHCTDQRAQFVFGSAAMRLMPAKLRNRFKTHLGSHQECQYLLATYGIPKQALPLSPMTNEAAFSDFSAWYQECERRERNEASARSALPESATDPLLYRPRPSDVLYGSGQTMNNAGNQRLRALVKELADEYESCNNLRKGAILDSMIEDIRSQGGRFLRRVDFVGVCNEISVGDARQKISQMFRNHRRLNSILERPPAASAVPNHPTQSLSVTILLETDVLFGSMNKRNHGGNLALRQMVKDLAPEYDNSTKGGKTKLAETVVQEVKKMGGRFLKRNDANDGWEIVSDDFARSKISKHFRNNRRNVMKEHPVVHLKNEIHSSVHDLWSELDPKERQCSK